MTSAATSEKTPPTKRSNSKIFGEVSGTEDRLDRRNFKLPRSTGRYHWSLPSGMTLETMVCSDQGFCLAVDRISSSSPSRVISFPRSQLLLVELAPSHYSHLTLHYYHLQLTLSSLTPHNTVKYTSHYSYKYAHHTSHLILYQSVKVHHFVNK